MEVMKRLFILLVIIVLSLEALPQPPQGLSFQCVVWNSSGALIVNQVVGMRTTILWGKSIYVIVYSETYDPKPQTNSNGVLTVIIGSGTPSTGTFSSINWQNGPFSLKTEIDPAGGTNYTILGQSQIFSVPYALYAERTGPVTETDPVWTEVSSDYYSKTNLQTQGGAKVHFGNLTERPTTLAGYGITDAVTQAYIEELVNKIEELEALTEKARDVSGNLYRVVKIGTQLWFGENLKTFKYNDSTYIPLVEDNTQWASLTTPGYCWYNNDRSTYENIYGALYNWYAINTGKLCPAGWHVALAQPKHRSDQRKRFYSPPGR